MSGPAKSHLNKLFSQLDQIFATVHKDDVPEMIDALRKDLSSRKSGTRRPAYDTHTSAVDG